MPLGAGLTFNVDSIRFDRAMAVLSREVEGGAPKVVKDETKLLLQQVIRFTPPKTLAQGRAAVARDVQRAMTPLDDTKFTSKKIATAIRQKNVNAMRDIVRRIPSMRDYGVEEFDPIKLHQNKRDSRGRIQRNKKIFVLDKKGWKRYAKATQKHVGSAKAGYWPGLQAVGGTVPSWVSRHSGIFGGVDAGKLYDPHSPRIRITNHSRAAISQEQQTHSVESAVRMRARSMEGKFRHLIAEKARLAGLEVH